MCFLVISLCLFVCYLEILWTFLWGNIVFPAGAWEICNVSCCCSSVAVSRQLAREPLFSKCEQLEDFCLQDWRDLPQFTESNNTVSPPLNRSSLKLPDINKLLDQPLFPLYLLLVTTVRYRDVSHTNCNLIQKLEKSREEENSSGNFCRN